jgi:hypothetical protein
MEMWRRCGEAASAAALYSVYSGLYSEAVVSSVASAVALVDVGQFREAVQYVQRAAKALYEAAKEAFEKVKVTVQRLVELFVEAVARVLAWVDEHKAYLFLMAAVTAGVVALSAALNMWGLVELERLAYAASLTPFIPAGVKEYSREEVFKILREAPDPYEKFREVAKAANAGGVKLAEPWESLRVLIMPKPSEEKRLMMGKAYSELDEGKKKALFYAVLALEEALGVYKSVLREVAEGLREAVQREEVGEGPFKQVRYMADLGRLTQLAEKEEAAFEEALRILRERLNEYAVKYGLRDLLDVEEGRSRGLAEAEAQKLSELNDVSFGVKALAALIAYREYALGRKSAYGTAVWYWLEVGGSAWLLYYAPWTAYLKAEKAKTERPAAVEELVAEALRRLFLKPGADHHRGFIEELAKGGKLALMLDKETESAYVFRFYSMKESDKLVDLGIELWISKVGKGIVYFLKFEDVERWLGFFKPELEAAVRTAVEVGGRLPVKDRFSYMVGWVDSDVAINRRRNERVLRMSTSHLWQLAETHALFGWSKIVELRMTLTLEGPKLAVTVKTPLERLDKAIRESAEGGWLKMLGINAGSWDGLKRWVVENWDFVVRAAVRRLGEEVRGELEALRDKLDDDKIAREVIAPALLLIQAERLGVNETTLRYFGAVISGAVDGDGYVSAAMGVVGLTSGERAVVLLWGAALAAHGIKAEVRDVGRGFDAVTSGGDAAKLAGLYFLYGSPLLEGDKKVFNYKLDEAVKLGAEGLSVSWEELRRTPSGHVAADLTISVNSATVKYNVYLRETDILLRFNSSDRDYVELAARLLKLAGVTAEVKREGGRDVWYVYAYTDVLAAAHKELRNAIANIVRKAVESGWVDAGKAERWLEKLEGGLTLKEGWPRYKVRLNDGALEVRYETTNSGNIQQERQRFRAMGLEEGKHFTVKMPEGGKAGYVSILRKGLEHAAWLSEYGSEEQRKLAAEFVEYILQRAGEEGKDVYRKAEEIVKEGKARGILKLQVFEGRVEVGGREHVVKVIDGNAELEKSESGKLLLRIRITAEVDGVKSEYTMTFSRRSKNNEAVGRATARADAPDGREADAERFSALVKALTGEEPWVYRINNGRIMIECGKSHLKGFMRFAELADAIARWLEETSRQ